MANLEEQMDNTDQMLISTKCINGHKFKVPKEKIQASSSGKSFVTLCPKCNKVARLRKEEVFQSFEINPRDPVAVGNLFASLSNQSAMPMSASQGTTSASVPVNGATFQDVVAGKNGAKKAHPQMEDDEDEDEDEDDEDVDEDSDDSEKEYTAQVESADDITGKKKKVQRFRVVSDEEEADGDDEEDDESDEYERTPVKAKKQTKKVRPRVRNVVSEDDDEDEDDEDEDDRRGSKRSWKSARRLRNEDEPADPNEILKSVIEGRGIDESDMDLIFDYIDLQPDGWQPAAIQGVLQTYMSPTAAAKIAQRYQAELYKEDKHRERERYLMSIVGTPAGNMRLGDMGGTNIPPFNNPLSRGAPPIGAPYPGAYPHRGDPYAQRGDPYAPQYQDPRAPPYDDPRMQPMAPMMRREAPSMSPFQVKQMISEELETRFEKLQNALTQTKREDSLQNELTQMRALVFDVLKQRPVDSGAGVPKTDPLLVSLLANQSDLNKTLLTHTIAKTDKEDPMQKILIQELMELKKARSAPPLTHTTEELTQRIQLQKLGNELELAQADFRDKAEGRAFARDLAGQALTKIGESFANAYLETQRTAAMQAAQVQNSGLTPPPAAPIEPLAPIMAETTQESKPQIGSNAQPRATDTSEGQESEKYHVKGVPQEDGSLSIPCPTCGSQMTARPGDTKVSCGTCGSSFNAGTPPQEEATQEVPAQEGTQEDTQEKTQEPVRKPKVIL